MTTFDDAPQASIHGLVDLALSDGGLRHSHFFTAADIMPPCVITRKWGSWSVMIMTNQQVKATSLVRGTSNCFWTLRYVHKMTIWWKASSSFTIRYCQMTRSLTSWATIYQRWHFFHPSLIRWSFVMSFLFQRASGTNYMLFTVTYDTIARYTVILVGGLSYLAYFQYIIFYRLASDKAVRCPTVDQGAKWHVVSHFNVRGDEENLTNRGTNYVTLWWEKPSSRGLQVYSTSVD